MKKKVFVLCLMIVFVLTGCGQENNFLQYANLDDVRMIDDKKEMKEALKEITYQDKGIWSYRLDKIQEIQALGKRIEATCKSEKTKVKFLNSYNDSESLDVWEQHAKAGKDPREERVLDMNIDLSMKDEASVLETCKKLGDLGFPCLKDYHFGMDYVEVVQGGYNICVSGKISEEELQELEEDDYPYFIRIGIPGMMAFGPERYFDLIDSCLQNDLYVARMICCNGAIDELILGGDKLAATVYIKDEKVLEIDVVRSGWKQGNFFTSQEQKGMIELVTKMCGDRNAALSMVRGLEKNGEKKGMVSDCKWSIEKDNKVYLDEDDTYILRIQ